jgi:dTMP kinase
LKNSLKDKLAGKFIVLDGPDGCGKSTQAKLLSEYLNSAGVVNITMRDPGSTSIGEKIRAILLNPAHDAMALRTELLLYMAARAQLWNEIISPALSSGKCVILDRWISSTCAYQGYAGGFGIQNVIRLAQCSLERVWPDLTIILDVDLSTSSKRLKAQLDRMEQKGNEYHKKVRDGFLELPRLPERFVVINTSADIETVHKQILNLLQDFRFGPKEQFCKC